MNRTKSEGTMDAWPTILSKLAAKIPTQAFNTWFRPTVCIGYDEAAVRLTVPNDRFRTLLLQNYGDVLKEAITEVFGTSHDLVILLETPESLPESSALPVVQAAALEVSAPSNPWLIEQLWTIGAVGFLGAPPKSFKTWLAMEMAVSVASGMPCLGTFPVPDPGPVLLYAAEDSVSAVRARLESLTLYHGVELGQLPFWVITADSLRLDRPDDQEKLEVTVARYQPRLLVLDPLIRLHQLDENASGPMAALLGFFRSLQRKTGTAIALVHHTGKHPAVAGYSLRGSSDFYAWTDSFLHLQRRRGQLTLTAEHRSAPPFGPVALELARDDTSNTHLKLVAVDADPTASSITSDPVSRLADRILELLSASPEPLAAPHLRSVLRVRNERLVEALRNLLSENKIHRIDRGYAIGKPSQKPIG
jgi:hypothetical protein